MKNTDVSEFITDLEGGAFERELGKVISLVAASVVEHGKKGKIRIDFNFEQIANSHQVKVTHKTHFHRPTSRGDQQESSASSTPMYVTAEGLSFYPSRDGQGSLIGKDGRPTDKDNQFPPEDK